MYALFARMFGTNNLPDSSNMCHETTGKALKKSIGVPVGTVTLDDFEQSDACFSSDRTPARTVRACFMSCNAQASAAWRSSPSIRCVSAASSVSPIRRTRYEMLTGAETQISCQYHQVKTGGDIAAIMGMCKALIEMDDAAAQTEPHACSITTSSRSTRRASRISPDKARETDWQDIEHAAGLSRPLSRDAAGVYARSNAVMAIYGMGLTQHHFGEQNLHMVCNLMLLRGNIGKPGAGLCPVRGHSNVQGQRTVGIAEDPKLIPMEKLKALYHFDPPTSLG